MARLVAAFGSSHSIMLVSRREDWQHGLRVSDVTNPHYYDRQGHKTDYATLLAKLFVVTLVSGYRFDLPPQNLEYKWSQLTPDFRDGLRTRLRAGNDLVRTDPEFAQ